MGQSSGRKGFVVSNFKFMENFTGFYNGFDNPFKQLILDIIETDKTEIDKSKLKIKELNKSLNYFNLKKKYNTLCNLLEIDKETGNYKGLIEDLKLNNINRYNGILYKKYFKPYNTYNIHLKDLIRHVLESDGYFEKESTYKKPKALFILNICRGVIRDFN